MLCLRLYCVSITKKNDMSITVIYHAMSLIVLYIQYYIILYLFYFGKMLPTQ
jgi:hypothetical protein